MKPQPATITSLSPPQATEIREKPDISEYEKEYEGIWLTQFYETALKDYQLSQVPMDIENNGYEVDGRVWITYGIQSIAEELKLNQSVQIVRTGDKTCKITKIL